MISRRLLRIKILQILYSHFNNDDISTVKSEKDLIFSIQKGYDLYHYLLLLAVTIKRYAESRIELALNKKLPTYEDLHPNTRFVENEIILQIEKSINFRKYTDEHVISWADYPELVKNLYSKLIESSYYKEYMERPESDYADDRQLLIDFYSAELEEYEMFNSILEEKSIFWGGNVEYIVSMVLKTIKEMQPDKFDIFPMYKNEDDSEFAFSLLRMTIVNYKNYNSLIENYIDNWDIDRVAQIDNLILQMAINELIVFPSIPINVTFDEYLELAKYYSTPKSSIFINGLLDKISTDLIEKQRIVKMGRGLDEE